MPGDGPRRRHSLLDTLGGCTPWQSIRLPAASNANRNDVRVSLEFPDGSAKATLGPDENSRVTYRVRVSGLNDLSRLDPPFGGGASWALILRASDTTDTIRVGQRGEIPRYFNYVARGAGLRHLTWDRPGSGYIEQWFPLSVNQRARGPLTIELLDPHGDEEPLGSQRSLCIEFTDSTDMLISSCPSSGSQEAADPPTVTDTPVLSGAGDDGTWTEGEKVGVSVTFSEAVDVDTTGGTPTIGIELGGPGGTAKTATYESGSGTTALTFGYTLVQADGDHGTMGVAADSLATGGGTIRSTASDVDADLAHVGTASPGSLARTTGPTASFQDVPSSHDGSSAFTVDVRFSGTPAGLDAKRDAASVLEVTGGSVTKARQTTGGANPVWEVTITPGGAGDVTVTVPARACNEAHAVCIGGQPLAEAAEATVAGLPTVSIAAASTPVIEGTAAAFTLSRTGDTSEALTVQVAISETGAVASGTLPTSATFAAGSATAALSVATEDDATAEDASTVTATVSAGTGYAVSESAGSAGVVVNDNDAALTASFSHAPSTHDGSTAFEMRFAFSHEPGGYSWRTVKDRLFTVTGGRIEKASRATPGSNIGWKIRVAPAGNADVTLTARATTDCTAQHAACDASGRKFDGNLTATVTGPQSQARALPVVSIAAPATTPVTEGTALAFTLTRTGATDAALTVNVSVTESGATLGANPPTTVTFAANSATAVLSVASVDDETVEEASTVTATVTAGTGYTAAGDASSAEGVVESEDLEPITASFTQVPGEHDGSSAFWAKITFSHALSGYSFRSMQAHLFDVTGGRIVKARRDGQPRNTKWAIQIVPAGNGDVTLDARATADCGAAHAVCDADGRKFDGNLAATVQGPPTLSVADAEVEEAEGATLDFVVTLSRAVNETVTVAYATSDGTAAAGFDYSATSDTLTFAANEVSKTVSARVLDDSHDEGSETLTFTLSNPNPSRVKLADAEAVGTITNDDAMPQAWIARFGRTVAEQVMDAVQGRMQAARQPGAEVSLGGHRIGLGPLFGARAPAPGADGEPAPGTDDARADAAQEAEAARAAADLAAWLKGGADFGAGAGPAGRGQSMDRRELLLGSSFGVTAGSDGKGFVSLWSRAAVTRFDGREGALALDGEVTSAMLGTDWSQGPWTAGLLVSHSLGEGGYSGGEGGAAGSGTIEAMLTGLYPWLRHALSDRLEAWGMAGYGEGRLTLKPGEAPAIRTDVGLSMAAAGLRGEILDGGGGGLTLVGKTDAMIVGTSTEAVSGGSGGNLAAAEAEVTRLRLGLEASRPVALDPGSGSGAGGGAVLTPYMEAGVRHDGGDAETGFGLDLGGGLTLADPKNGLQAEIRGRGLLSHQSRGFRELGFSGALSWQQNPSSDRGAAVTLTQTVGGSSSDGAQALLERGTLEGLAANDNGADNDDLESRRLELRLGYGLSAFGNRFTLTPEAGLGLSDTGRDMSLGWRLAHRATGGLIGALEVSFEAKRRESATNDNAPPEHEAGLRLTARW